MIGGWWESHPTLCFNEARQWPRRGSLSQLWGKLLQMMSYKLTRFEASQNGDNICQGINNLQWWNREAAIFLRVAELKAESGCTDRDCVAWPRCLLFGVFSLKIANWISNRNSHRYCPTIDIDPISRRCLSKSCIYRGRRLISFRQLVEVLLIFHDEECHNYKKWR